MLIGGKEKLERMRDGRAVYIGAERVDDVTAHPAFRNGARTIAGLYELKSDPRRRDLFSFEENGERYGLPWLRCRNREDLARRVRAMKAIADASYGLIGRSPDHVAGLITGLAMNPALLDGLRPGCGDNLLRYYEYARKSDLYLSFAVTPPSGIRSREIFTGEARDDPTLRVVGEGDDGVVISGMKMLATGAVFADEVWIGNLTPIDDERASESITCVLPINAHGVSFWAREPYERHARHEADYPLSFRFDETDTVLLCDRVKVPWERVFLHNNGAMSRRIYIETPANCYQNQQSNVRFWAKMGLIVGLASRMCQANGVDKIPAVRETLGRLAALEATVAGLVNGQIEACENWPSGYVTPNRQMVYATLNWVPGAPHRDHRYAAHACGRRPAADAGEHRSRRRSRA
jgi:4-hydroxyphenylacetate 3-monooxygenase